MKLDRLDQLPEPYSRLRDDEETIFELARLSDPHGFLLLHHHEVEEWRQEFEKVRIFNA